jgi:hypothetical protein
MSYRIEAIIDLPKAHESQKIFTDWHLKNPETQTLIAPAGTKVGKTFGSSIWLLDQALANPNFFCVWLAPTLFKCRIAYRYMKSMLPDIDLIDCKDGKMEIWLANGSSIKFLHGRDAEVTVEGEAIDAFVMDEAGKQNKQLWFSLFTTITQTMGLGIITGTPRGHNWYYDVFRQAKHDPFFCWAQLQTSCSPYVKSKAVEQAKRILPKHLFEQYYLALFVAQSTVYGDLSGIWTGENLITKSVWFHPDPDEFKKPVCIGYDPGKRQDPAAIVAVNADGQLVAYARMKQKEYQFQRKILRGIMGKFTGPSNMLNFDRTGVGDAIGEGISQIIESISGDWTVNPMVFMNSMKQDLVSRLIVSIEHGWLRSPRIEVLEHELGSLEVTNTKSGMASYGAPKGEHDDVHWALAMAVFGSHSAKISEATLTLIEKAMSGELIDMDDEPESMDDDSELVDEILNEETNDLELAFNEDD